MWNREQEWEVERSFFLGICATYNKWQVFDHVYGKKHCLYFLMSGPPLCLKLSQRSWHVMWWFKKADANISNLPDGHACWYFLKIYPLWLICNSFTCPQWNTVCWQYCFLKWFSIISPLPKSWEVQSRVVN